MSCGGNCVQRKNLRCDQFPGKSSLVSGCHLRLQPQFSLFVLTCFWILAKESLISNDVQALCISLLLKSHFLSSLAQNLKCSACMKNWTRAALTRDLTKSWVDYLICSTFNKLNVALYYLKFAISDPSLLHSSKCDCYSVKIKLVSEGLLNQYSRGSYHVCKVSSFCFFLCEFSFSLLHACFCMI